MNSLKLSNPDLEITKLVKQALELNLRVWDLVQQKLTVKSTDVNPDWDLEYFHSKDWETVQEKLDELDRKGTLYNPARHLLFNVLDHLSYADVKVLMVGQDPYPNHADATGIAFSIPNPAPGEPWFQHPTSLRNILNELCADLHVPYPDTGCLIPWVKQGVLLWNAIPTVLPGLPKSMDWPEWKPLTRELIRLCIRKSCPIVFMGSVAKKFAYEYPEEEWTRFIFTPHPCARGGKFKGCRVFSKVNSLLNEPIDWRL